jgi:hypothetical protein
MASISLTSLLLIGVLMAERCFSVDPSIAQVDLVFPRNNTVYRPIYPFPIVFVLHNFSTIWSYKPALNWQLLKLSPDNVWNLGEMGSMGWTYNARPDWSVPAAVTMGVNHSDQVGKGDTADRVTEWRLDWEFRLGPQLDAPGICFGPRSQNDTGTTTNSTTAYFTGSISFNVNNSTGVIPDLAGRDNCSVPLAGVSYLGRDDTKSRCSLVTLPKLNPNTCAFSMDKKAADQVSQAMATASKCKGAEWPSLTTRCANIKSAMTKLEWNPYLILLAALVFTICFER